jgi:glutamate racemase
MNQGPIGIFDSGYGGLTVMREIVNTLPQYDYLYLGDNARAPYGSRSFESIYQYTLECVNYLFSQNCSLVILACNTASAKALRTIQQKDLPIIAPEKRVLGVIRPTAEMIGNITHSKEVGILGTSGTVNSQSYVIEIEKLFPQLKVFQEACPMWVPLIENNEFENEGANYFIRKNIEQLLNQSDRIDTVLLGCTHYPILYNTIKKILPSKINLLSQGHIVAEALKDYLKRHPEIESKCRQSGTQHFLTTDDNIDFNTHASLFFGKSLVSKHIQV